MVIYGYGLGLDEQDRLESIDFRDAWESEKIEFMQLWMKMIEKY